MTRIGLSTLAKRVIKIEISATTISSTWAPRVSIISNLAPLAYVKNQRSQYRTGQYSRYLSDRLVNRYRSTYVLFRFKFRPIPDLPALLEKIGCFGRKYDSGWKWKNQKNIPLKKKRKKPRKCYRHRFQPCNPLCFFF